MDDRHKGINIKMNINDAIKIMRDNVTDVYALAYLDNIPNAIDDDGVNGMCVQLKYALENAKKWRGSLATDVKKTINEWICKREKKEL